MEWGVLLQAVRDTFWTSGVESTALGNIDRTWKVPFEKEAFAFRFGIGNGYRSQEGLGIRMLGIAVQLLGFCHFHDTSKVHHSDPITRVPYHVEIVGDEEQSEMILLSEVLEEVDDLGLNGDIKRGDRLISNDQLRLE